MLHLTKKIWAVFLGLFLSTYDWIMKLEGQKCRIRLANFVRSFLDFHQEHFYIFLNLVWGIHLFLSTNLFSNPSITRKNWLCELKRISVDDFGFTFTIKRIEVTSKQSWSFFLMTDISFNHEFPWIQRVIGS